MVWKASSIIIIITISLIYCTLSIAAVSAASISGRIYDLSYDIVGNVIVRINSTPSQTVVASDGSYSFYLPRGNYLLTAEYGIAPVKSVTETFAITDDGNYTLDLILFDDISGVEGPVDAPPDTTLDLPNATGAPGAEPATGLGPIMLALIFALVVIGIILLLFLRSHAGTRRQAKPARAQARNTLERNTQVRKPSRSHQPPANPDTVKVAPSVSPSVALRGLPDQVLSYLAKHDGRATQKEIRAQFPYSEAKMSLVLSELEHDAKVRRIKKGRGNIIVLVK